MKKIDNYTKKFLILPRGINSAGNIQTLKLLKKLDGLNIRYFQKKKVFDWAVLKDGSHRWIYIRYRQ